MPDILQTAYAMTTHAYINATVPTISIPAEITPLLNNSGSDPNSLTNITSISGLIALGTSAFAFIKDRLGNKTMDKRSDALVNNDQHLLNSQKSTDIAAQETSTGINALIMKLSENPDIAKLLNTPTDANHGLDGKSVSQFFNDDKNEWKDSNQNYYMNKTPMPDSNSKDPILQKSSEIAQLTTPTPT